ncbi:MAG: TIGR04282 family arsenosugar biosynthesis glycosyltransferase [Betaproteobacteria bacterium]|nr:TIGR04282 family arsenosugar biosynthesis glycosyltransferase [Betaproteobacteria bacterium]
MAADAKVLIFAKAPVPGQVKTRLAKVYTTEAAAMLHAALTERALETALSSGLDVVLFAAPDASHPWFATCAEDFGVTIDQQLRDADLGERMLDALDRTLRGTSLTIIIGADCPALTAKHLHLVLATFQVEQCDIVLIPAEDGGYVLIAARRTHPEMFKDIAWGTDTVLAQQRAALRAAGLTWTELETLWDVDRPEDLPRLRALKPPLDFTLPSSEQW